MANPAQEAAAVLRYNDADEYVHVVLALATSYEHGDYAAVPAPAPRKTPTQTPTPQPTAPSSTAAAITTPTPTAPAPATPAPAGATEPGSTPSGQPSQAPVPSATLPVHPGQNVDIGWAPAMRQVVVQLLTAPKAAPTQPAQPAHHGPRQTVASADPARKTQAATSSELSTSM